MKTTIELPDELLIEAKAVAARRRTTLKAMMEHALRREIDYKLPTGSSSKAFTYNEDGFPVMRKTGNTIVTNEMIQAIMEESEDA